MKQFLSIDDVPDPMALIKEAISIKANPFADKQLGQNKTLGLIFFNASLRTRMSTQKAAQNLGMEVMVLNVSNDSWQIEFEDGAIMSAGTAEHIKEAAAVLSQYCDIIGVRTFAQLQDFKKDYDEVMLKNFVQYATVPIISLESATLHPLQSLADAMTIEEFKTIEKPNVVLTWAPHPRALPQAVPNSFAQWMNKMDVNLTITHPKGYELQKEFVGNAKVTTNQDEALANADFVYVKNWSSINEYGKVINTDNSWMITSEKMALTNAGKFMHCLPVRRNVIVADEVIDSESSIVIEQAANRVYSAQAVLKEMLKWKS
ncbi:MAG: N-acetylornithine carbamoyltransferase [Bacteroidota bacterium]